MRSAPPTRVREAPGGNGVWRLRGPHKMAVRLRGQRLMTFVHLFCFLWALFSLSQNVGLPHSLRRESENTYGGRWKYLTFINQVLQTLLFGICVILDFACVFIPAKKNHVSSRLLPPRDFLFSVLVFPVGLFVAVTFWTLYAYDRELVYPKELDETTPSWLNHTMGTMGKLCIRDLGIPNFRSTRHTWKGGTFYHFLPCNGRILLTWRASNTDIMG
ncbi:androgen-dependent TFPI-regulating protein-like isoform X2 [Chelonia mydas]|uniref:androgen-dependent TFPI-regulating protein-like isoform X2 n=1 Tax=Chelonia mydas TaxID=8469 RepID=UPI001CA8A255|nr:androgen-dependent TFPI-regulating protein-like isoform X2 [Chelonia mydas]